MWEISDERYEWMKERVKRALEEMKKREAGKEECWAHYVVGYLGVALEQTLSDLNEMRPSEHGMTEDDLDRLEAEVEAKR